MEYIVRKAAEKPSLSGDWDGPVWSRAETLGVTHFLANPHATDHRPGVRARALYDANAVYVHFHVRDRYVRSIQTEYQSGVCTDSCVEFFVRPKADKGYLNFEINAGGTMLVYYIEDPRPAPGGGFTKWEPVRKELGDEVAIYHSLPSVVDPEITEPVEWQIEYAIPLALFEAYVGPVGVPTGQVWSANFYKCADNTSHPHWASWSPVVGTFSFHTPSCFSPILFE